MFRLMRLQERNFTIWRGNVKSYLKMDFYRMLTSKYFGIGILGVVGVYGLSLMQLKSQDVYLLNYYIKFYSTYMLLLIFGAVAYSNAMMEDLEYKNYYLQIQKGSFRKYIWSKVITAFISAVIVMVLGTSIFCLMAHFKMPLLSPDNDMLEYLADGDYLSQLITPETIFWYLIADAAMTGLMAGIFSVFAMWLSLFVKNQMFTVMVPIVPWGVCLVYLGFGAGLPVFIFTGTIKSIPQEIEESAMIDGAGAVRTFFTIVVPMMRSSIITVAILQTMWIWNDYLLPYLTLDLQRFKTIPIVIQYLRGGYGSIDMGALMACLVLAIIPIVIFFALCQKYIIQGITAGAVKG